MSLFDFLVELLVAVDELGLVRALLEELFNAVYPFHLCLVD